MATFNSVEIPQYSREQPLIIEDGHLKTLKDRENHIHDPLGDLYIGYKTAVSAAPLIEEMSIPKEIINAVVSYIECVYSESTWDCPIDNGWWHSNPTINYGTEAMIVFTPPKQTKLPSNSYTLDKMRYRLGNDEENSGSACQLFVGIQVFDLDNLCVPGKGDIIYADTLQISETDLEFTIKPCVDLVCGKSYLFWATSISGTFSSGLIDGEKEKSVKCRELCKISNCTLNYYSAKQWQQGQNKYRVRYDFMTFYEAFFVYKE